MVALYLSTFLSGAHLNPAVPSAMAVLGTISRCYVCIYHTSTTILTGKKLQNLRLF
ncbi:aquaporin [Streptococcus sp. SQ9-PEA]|uniref:Aquaporin n=1 Tax=Streptococcus sciuri TaxID=2973939 RepID=A0ABT2F6V1_9STRE|nr:aquaporin [Streptococcus sciuri]MCS4488164.1 aquaporin [Streptococcus sciuri]